VTANVNASAAPGTVTVTGSATNLTSGTVDLTSVVVGDASALAIDTPADTVVATTYSAHKSAVVVKLVDGSGNVLTQDSTSTVYVNSISGATDSAYAKVFDTAGNQLTVGDSTSNVSFVKGYATFWVTDKFADALTLKFQSNTTNFTQTVGANFTPDTAVGLAVATSNPAWINGDGVGLTTVTGSVVDQFGNVVTGASGNMTFAISSGSDFATLLQTSAPITNGQASVVAQSKLVTSNANVQIKVSFDYNNDGTVETATATAFSVDGTNPTAVVSPISISSNAITPVVTVNGTGAPVSNVTFQYKIGDNGAWQNLDSQDNVSNGAVTAAHSIATATDAAGTKYYVQAVVTDAAGRTFTSDSVSVTK
jgi:hypothetical protein